MCHACVLVRLAAPPVCRDLAIQGLARRCVMVFFFQAEDGIRDLTDWSSDVCSSDLMKPPGMISKKRTLAANFPGKVIPPSDRCHNRQRAKATNKLAMITQICRNF